jgi:hypothetical protein
VRIFDPDRICGAGGSSAPFFLPMRLCFVLAALVLCALPSSAQSDPGKSTTPVRKPARVPVRTSGTHQTSSRQAASRQSVPAHPSAPSADRYREIQESLISKGYLQSPASGVWDQNSMDAMRKFQTDQKQEPTGKITAKALIDLGLGPKEESLSPTATK